MVSMTYREYMDKYDEDPYELEVEEKFNMDEKNICPRCGRRMKKTFETYEAYGGEVRLPTYECDYC